MRFTISSNRPGRLGAGRTSTPAFGVGLRTGLGDGEFGLGATTGGTLGAGGAGALRVGAGCG